jgi:serine protease Do
MRNGVRHVGTALGLLLLTAPGFAQATPQPAAADTLRTTPGGQIPPPPNTPEQKTLLVQMQDAFINIAKTVEPTVVNIKSERPASGDDGSPGDGATPLPTPPKKGAPLGTPGQPHALRRSEATGSGVIVRADGYILTNDHVIDQALGGTVTVTLADGREFTGKVYPDFKSDLAIVKIDPGNTPLPVATFADSSKVRPGQWAIAVGSPFDLQNTVTVGIISAVNRHQFIQGEGSDGRYYPDLLQTDAAINPGNSGGPLFDIDGKVVGINVAIKSPVDGSAGVGFAIPEAIAQQIAGTLIAQGKVVRGYLGLAPDDLTPSIQQASGQKEGAYVRDVIVDSPAGKAGLQAGDVVTRFDGKPIADEITLREAIAATTPGQKVDIGYVRDGKTGSAAAVIAAPQPLAGDVPATPIPSVAARLRLGVGIRDLTARDRQQLTLPMDAPGVYVVTVVPGSAGETAGLFASMVIQKFNATSIYSKQDFQQAVTDLSGSDVTMVVLYTDPSDSQVHQRALTFRL